MPNDPPAPRTTGSPLSDLVDGGLYPLRALAVIQRSPHLWRYIIIPVVLNIVVGALLYGTLLALGFQQIDALLAPLPEWAWIAHLVLRALLVLLLFMGLGFVLLRFGVVLGAPWYSQLSERLEHAYLDDPRLDSSGGVLTIARDILDALSFEAKKLLFFFSIFLPLLLLNLLPVAGSLLVLAGSIGLGAFIVCLDFFDSSLSRRRLGFRAKLGLVQRSAPASLGFGLVCLGLVSIPFLNLLAVPLCVTAGTLFFCDRLWPRLRHEHGAPPPPPAA